MPILSLIITNMVVYCRIKKHTHLLDCQCQVPTTTFVYFYNHRDISSLLSPLFHAPMVPSLPGGWLLTGHVCSKRFYPTFRLSCPVDSLSHSHTHRPPNAKRFGEFRHSFPTSPPPTHSNSMELHILSFDSWQITALTDRHQVCAGFPVL